MGDPTIADVMEMLKSLTTEMKTMKADMTAMQEKSASSADRDVGGRLEEPRDSKNWIFPATTARPIRCSSSISVNPIFVNNAP
jgi:hypothetical protein